MEVPIGRLEGIQAKKPLFLLFHGDFGLQGDGQIFSARRFIMGSGSPCFQIHLCLFRRSDGLYSQGIQLRVGQSHIRGVYGCPSMHPLQIIYLRL